MSYFAESNSAAEITCTKETGNYDPSFLARCEETNAFSTGFGMQKMTISNSAQRVLLIIVLHNFMIICLISLQFANCLLGSRSSVSK